MEADAVEFNHRVCAVCGVSDLRYRWET